MCDEGDGVGVWQQAPPASTDVVNLQFFELNTSIA